MKHRLFQLGLISLTFMAMSCKNVHPNEKMARKDSVPAKPRPSEQESLKGNFNNQESLVFPQDSLSPFFKKFPLFRDFESDFRSFYKNRNYTYAWYDDKGLIEQAGNLFSQIENISDQGVAKRMPYQEQFESMLDSAGIAESGTQANLETELMITGQYMSYAKSVYMGIPDKQALSVDWLVPKKKISYTQLLDSMLRSPSGTNPEPVNRQYGLLRAQLKKYRDIEAMGGWPRIITKQKKFDLGDSSAAIIAIRKKLWLVGDLTGDTLSPVFGPDLQKAVRRFQHRYGLKEDGVAGVSVLKEMNNPVSKRIEQIMVNMERARWVPIGIDRNYIVVNIPEYRLHVFEGDSREWSCSVVVGKAANKTVIFSGDLKYVVFSPYWNVPPSITKSEVVPGMKKNKSYLASHNMEITGYSGGMPVVRQKPGPDNSLGLVKFLFPNSHNIYLHDSPAKGLFQEEKRAFSHGCIRVSEPRKLAIYLLRFDSDWTPDKVDAAMNAGKEKWVTLKDPVPVFIVYFTAWVDPQGNLNFRDDIYSRDSRLAKMLFEKSSL